jgi:hypothetical protein
VVIISVIAAAGASPPELSSKALTERRGLSKDAKAEQLPNRNRHKTKNRITVFFMAQPPYIPSFFCFFSC